LLPEDLAQIEHSVDALLREHLVFLTAARNGCAVLTRNLSAISYDVR